MLKKIIHTYNTRKPTPCIIIRKIIPFQGKWSNAAIRGEADLYCYRKTKTDKQILFASNDKRNRNEKWTIHPFLILRLSLLYFFLILDPTMQKNNSHLESNNAEKNIMQLSHTENARYKCNKY